MAIERVGAPCKRTAILFFWFLSVVMAPSLSLGQVAPRWEVFGGYSYRRFDSPTVGFTDHSNLNGWNAGATFNLTPQWGIAADISGQYGSKLSAYNFLIGPQYSWRKEKSKFFVHALFGKAQNTVNIKTSTRNGFESVGRAIALGGGYDFDLTPRFTIRAVQAEYVNTHTFGNTQNDVRISTGLVFHIGQIGRRPKL
jgi:hypothetical protein